MNKRLVILDSEHGRYDFHDDGYNVSMVGCTLWANRRADQEAHVGFNDRLIVGKNSKKNNELHQADLAWLKREILNIRAEEKDRVIIVMTHHAPSISGTSAPARDGRGNSWSDYQNDILGGEGMPGLQIDDVWVFGHTHWSTDIEVDGVRVYSNQRGGIQKANMQQRNRKKPEWYDETRILEIECPRANVKPAEFAK